MRKVRALFPITAVATVFWMATAMSGDKGPVNADSAISMHMAGDPDLIFEDRFEVLATPIETCADGAQCLIDCGSFSNVCVDDCTASLATDEEDALMDLQFCAIQACYYLGQCTISDFNAPECVQCRLGVNEDPGGFGCAAEGMACGI